MVEDRICSLGKYEIAIRKTAWYRVSKKIWAYLDGGRMNVETCRQGLFDDALQYVDGVNLQLAEFYFSSRLKGKVSRAESPWQMKLKLILDLWFSNSSSIRVHRGPRRIQQFCSVALGQGPRINFSCQLLGDAVTPVWRPHTSTTALESQLRLACSTEWNGIPVGIRNYVKMVWQVIAEYIDFEVLNAFHNICMVAFCSR